jgi:MerR family transcriptional regulator, thiopeptide resistance regulator
MAQVDRELFGKDFFDGRVEETAPAFEGADPFQDSQKRMSERTKKDWTRIQAEVEESNAAFAAVMDAGLPATGAKAMDIAEQHRLHVRRWFFDLTPELHRNLGDKYVTDPRFTKNYEGIRTGMSQYVRDAIHANADRAAGAAGRQS